MTKETRTALEAIQDIPAEGNAIADAVKLIARILLDPTPKKEKVKKEDKED